MVFIYEKPEFDGDIFKRVGTIKNYNSFSFDFYINRKGSFELQVPLNARYSEQLVKGNVIYTQVTKTDTNKNKTVAVIPYSGIITDIKISGEEGSEVITVSGKDFKVILDYRITVPADYADGSVIEYAGTAGYDAVTGATETCIKHFVNNNVNNPSQSWRRIPAFYIAPNQERGNQEDKYMSRHEVVSDVVLKLCEAEKLGYSIVPNFDNNLFIFDVFEGTDRTDNQTENPPVIFSLKQKSILSYEYENSNENYKSVFHTTMAGSEFADETLTALYYKEEEIPRGWECIEQHLNVSVNTPEAGEEYNELKRLALIEMANYEIVENLEGRTNSKHILNKDYFIGDFITVDLPNIGVTLDTQITGMSVSTSFGSIEINLVFGNKKPTYTDKINKKIKNGG